MQLSEQLGRAELNTMDSDVGSWAFSVATLIPETSVLQWEWHVHSEHLAILTPQTWVKLYSPNILFLSPSTHLLS